MLIRIKNYYYRIVKSRTLKKIAGIFLILLIIGAVAAIFIAQKFSSAETRANFLRENPSVTKVLPVYWKLRKISDITYLSYFFKKDEVPNYELAIADSNLEKINDSLPDGFMNVIYTDKVFVPGEFRADGKTYQVRVRYRGANAIHWNAAKRSYLVRFDKDDLFRGMRELNFIIPDDRFFAVEHFNNYRAEKLGLKVPESGYANLEVGGQGNALYFTIEGWSDEMLKRWNLPAGAIFYGNDFGATWENLSGWEILASDSGSQDFSKLDELLRLLNNAKNKEFYAKIFDIVDKENFYAWQIHQELVNSTHQATDNHRFYFDSKAGKFFFVPWDVEIESLKEKDNFGYYGPLAKRIFSNPIYLEEKNQRLGEYLSDEKNLEADLNFYDTTYENFKASLYKDRLKIYTNRFADKIHQENRRNIINIFNRLRDGLGGAVRIEDDYNLEYPQGKSDEIFDYLKSKYVDDQSNALEFGPGFTSSYADEDFIDTYFDASKLELYERKAGLRYRLRLSRLDLEADKSGRELVQLKLSGDDKFTDQTSSGSRNEIKFDVQRGQSTNAKDNSNPVLSLIAAEQREELKFRLSELAIDVYDLRPILTVKQHRRRVYLINPQGETFISFSVDDAASELGGKSASFSQMEIELNEVVYTAADEAARVKMKNDRDAMVRDLQEHFGYFMEDKSIKYTKMFDLLDKELWWMRFRIRIGLLRGSMQPVADNSKN